MVLRRQLKLPTTFCAGRGAGHEESWWGNFAITTDYFFYLDQSHLVCLITIKL